MPNEIYRIDTFHVKYPLSVKEICYKGHFQLNKNDIVLLTGPSGCGKSTLLKAMRGIIPRLLHAKVDSGLFYRNVALQYVGETKLAEIGFLHQNPSSQIICDDVYSELAFGLENRCFGAKEIESKINKIIDSFGLGHLIYRKTNQLSEGEKQLVNIMSLLLVEPDLLLLDEPTAFLDPKSAKRLVNLLPRITMIVTEHSCEYFQGLANRFLHIDSENNLKEIGNIGYIKPIHLKSKCALSNELLLEVKNLSFSYPNRAIFNNIDLRIKVGQIVGITGSSGVGKSTLLQLILGLLPSSTEITFRGQSVIDLKRIHNKISIVWQNSDLHFFKDTALEETENLRDFGLLHVSNRSPFSLSEGEKRRLSIAIALDSSSELLLIDEPTFGQDSLSIEIIMHQLLLANKRGKSMIIVSHDIQFLSVVCNTIYCLDSGRLTLC
jgi:energy-coupling factor transporter ATP-binding protein EcfA2